MGRLNVLKSGCINPFYVALAFIILLILPNFAFSIPPLPTEYYGFARLYGMPVPPGTPITAYDSRGNICGKFVVYNVGYYGTLTCRGADENYGDLGPIENEQIYFKVGTFPATLINSENQTSNYSRWHTGTFLEVNLISPPLVCGDGFCDRGFESCVSCPEDCGECPITPSKPPSGGGGSGGGDSSAGSGTVSGGGRPQESVPLEEALCDEKWVCSEWSECFPNGTKIRECIDLNSCNTTKNKPDTIMPCIYEEKIIFNDSTVYNYTNQTTEKEEPSRIISACSLRLGLLSWPSLIFYLIIFSVVALRVARLSFTLKMLDNNKKLDDIKKAILKYKATTKAKIFISIFLVISIIIYLYHYFFALCPKEYFENIWLLIFLLMISPLIIAGFIRFFSYDEARKIRRVKLLYNTHYKSIQNLIKIANQELLRTEAEIANDIYQLGQNSDLSEAFSKAPEVYQIYKDMLKLYLIYKENKDAKGLEEDLLVNIERLKADKQFEAFASNYPDIKRVLSNLYLLGKAYESKQMLTKGLKEIEFSIEHQNDTLKQHDEPFSETKHSFGEDEPLKQAETSWTNEKNE